MFPRPPRSNRTYTLCPYTTRFRSPLPHHLGPAARRAAEVNHAGAALQKVEAVVELGQLEGGQRAIAALARLGDVGVVELALQPAGGRRGAPLGGLHPDLEAAPLAVPPARAAPAAPPPAPRARKDASSGKT